MDKKFIYISIFSNEISKNDFSPFWSTFIHTIISHSLKVQIQLEINSENKLKMQSVNQNQQNFLKPINFSKIGQSSGKDMIKSINKNAGSIKQLSYGKHISRDRQLGNRFFKNFPISFESVSCKSHDK
jgi:hypothetical protein